MFYRASLYLKLLYSENKERFLYYTNNISTYNWKVEAVAAAVAIYQTRS